MNDALQRLVQGVEEDSALLQPDQLHRRIEALDLLDAHFATGSASLCADESVAVAICSRARDLAARLEAVNTALYAAIRTEIQQGAGATALLRWVASGTDVDKQVSGIGYDSLDELIHGVLAFDEPESPPALLGSEMVFYQPTPARHILRLIKITAPSEADVLVDLGSGLGHVPLLVGICTAARSIGIELEASYIACARQCAQGLHLSGVSFLQQDVRTADLSSGTVFYLHTPFIGTMMRSVLDRLRGEAETRSIRICTYGPCTAEVAKESWLQAVTATETDQIAVFLSRV